MRIEDEEELKPMTEQEAERAYREAPEAPLSKDEIEKIVRKVVDNSNGQARNRN